MNEPAMGIEPRSVQAIEWATMYSQFHWGIIPWAIYSIATIPVAYSLHVKRQPFLRFSSAAQPLLGRHSEGAAGKLIDLVVILSILGGVGTSLGLSIPLVSGLLQTLLDLEESTGLNMLVLFVWTVLFSYSAYMGLGKGIKVLSDINISLAFALLLFVLLVGPTIFILKLWVNSVGLYLDNFIRISLWTDPVSGSGFTEQWTVFYWAWWIAYAPMMALFIARISRGRTIREVILNEVLWGSVGCMAFFAIWGGYAIFLETEGMILVSEILKEKGTHGAVIAILQSLPGGWLILGLFTLLCFIFLATTLDSAAYTLASVSTKYLSGSQEPARWNRLVWAFLIAFVGVALLLVGGLDIVQISTLVFSLPMMGVLILLCFSLIKQLRSDFPELSDSPVLVLGNSMDE
jgi:BCCT family betaine/carnitine transporter